MFEQEEALKHEEQKAIIHAKAQVSFLTLFHN